MKSLKVDDESQWRKFRRVAYEIWRKGTKTSADEDQYMQIGDIVSKEMTEEELDKIWNKYGKIN
jgi:hypothetical protein